MGFWEDLWDKAKDVGSDIVGGVVDVGSDIVGSIGGGVVDVASSWIGNELVGIPNAKEAYKQSREASAEAFERSYGAYKTRYQDTMSDMKAAGLNPILAAGSGGFTVSGQPQMQAAQGYQAHNPQMNFSNSAKNLADVNLKKTQNKLVAKQVISELHKAAKLRAEKGLISQQEKIAVQNVTKVIEEVNLILVKQKQVGEQVGLTEKQQKELSLKIKKASFQLNELEKTSKIYGAPAGHILKFFELVIKSLTPKIISLGAE